MKPRISYMGYIKQWRVIGADGVAFGRTVKDAWKRYQTNPQHLFASNTITVKRPPIYTALAKVMQ